MIFIVIFSFILIAPVLTNFILVSELLWICLYSYSMVNSIMLDSLIYFIFTIIILCLAAGESAFGLALLIFRFSVYHGASLFTTDLEEQNRIMLRFL